MMIPNLSWRYGLATENFVVTYLMYCVWGKEVTMELSVVFLYKEYSQWKQLIPEKSSNDGPSEHGDWVCSHQLSYKCQWRVFQYSHYVLPHQI